MVGFVIRARTLMGHTPILTDTGNIPAQLQHDIGYGELVKRGLVSLRQRVRHERQRVRLQGVGLKLFGAANAVVFFHTRIAAFRSTRSSEGDPSCALRHSSRLKSAVVIDRSRTDGNPTTIKYRPDREQCTRIILGGSSSHSSIVSYYTLRHTPIERGSTSNRFVRGKSCRDTTSHHTVIKPLGH
jgi:hypothetical protein